jgi:hypothetical protein
MHRPRRYGIVEYLQLLSFQKSVSQKRSELVLLTAYSDPQNVNIFLTTWWLWLSFLEKLSHQNKLLQMPIFY